MRATPTLSISLTTIADTSSSGTGSYIYAITDRFLIYNYLDTVSCTDCWLLRKNFRMFEQLSDSSVSHFKAVNKSRHFLCIVCRSFVSTDNLRKTFQRKWLHMVIAADVDLERVNATSTHRGCLFEISGCVHVDKSHDNMYFCQLILSYCQKLDRNG